MFGLFGSKNPTRRHPFAAAEKAVKDAGRAWDSADVGKRTELLDVAGATENDRMFLAFVNSPWSQLPESTRLKISEVLIGRDTEEHFVRTAAKHMGEIVADSYSEPEFGTVFATQRYNENWSRERSLGIWHGLGRFCLFIAMGRLQRLKRQYFDAAVSAGEAALLSRWKMSDATRQAYQGFGAKKIPLLLQIYRQIDNSEKHRLFFMLVISEILGNEVHISADDFSSGYLALSLRSAKMDADLIVLDKVLSMFSKVVEATQLFDRMLPL